jgi:hypothetical protein
MNFLFVATLSGKIINGYEADINTAREGLKKLNILIRLDTTWSQQEMNRLKDHAARLSDFILYYELTERLLFQFRMISTEIYDEIDAIKDAKDTPVDVYVKFLPIEKMKGSVAAMTNIPLGDDGDAYNSSYGLHSVSVQIIAGNNALRLLAHEFGHIKYQVPNIATYRNFYIRYYQNKTNDSEEIGHHHMDPSGNKAFEFETAFRRKHDDFLATVDKRLERPVALIQKIRRELE